MTSVPPSPSPARPSRSRGSRIIRVLRSRYFLCGFFSGAVGSLHGILSGHVSGVSDIFAHPIADVITTQIVVTIVLAAHSRSGGIRDFWRNRNLRGRSGVLIRHARGRDATSAGSGLMAGAAWRVMRAAARLMPRAAGSRWLAEAASFLSEAPPAQRRRALRSYLTAAPKTILVSWASHLARRTRAR